MNPFPNESPEYRTAREKLLAAEIELRSHTERVAAQRRKLPLGGAVKEDYVFESVDGPVPLSQLFAPAKDTLFLYSFMFIPGERGLPLEVACPSCTSIIDGLDGAIPHIAQRLNVAVAAKVPLEQLSAHAEARGWRNVRLLSSAHSTYNRDYQAESESGAQLPLATVFSRHDDRIHHRWSSELFAAPADPGTDPRHVDFIWPIWAVFDVTPDGRGTDWHPALEYR